MENQNKSNTTLIKRNKSFFEDEKVMPFALSDNESDSDDEFSLRARNKKGDNMLISKHNKSSRSGEIVIMTGLIEQMVAVVNMPIVILTEIMMIPMMKMIIPQGGILIIINIIGTSFLTMILK